MGCFLLSSPLSLDGGIKGYRRSGENTLEQLSYYGPCGDAFLFSGLFFQICIHEWRGWVRVEGVNTESSLGLKTIPRKFSKMLDAPGRGAVFPRATFTFPSHLVT